MKTQVLRLTLCMVLLASFGFAQDLEKVRLFQSYFMDTPISKTNHVQPGLDYGSYDGFSTLAIGANGGYVVNEKLEIQGALNYLSWSMDGHSESGLSDLALYGRYKLTEGDKPTQFSAGGLLTLPIGSEDVGASKLNFGGFGAVRHKLANGMIITGNAALVFYETTKLEFNKQTFEMKEKTEYESSFNIGAGVIYPMDDKISIVGELVTHSEGDYMMLSGGVDYNMGNGRLRGALGIGMDDGAPDLRLMAGYLLEL